MNASTTITDIFQKARSDKRLPSAILLCGDNLKSRITHTQMLTNLFMCKEKGTDGCGCHNCQWHANDQHPDLYSIGDFSCSSIIKVDDIRKIHGFIATVPTSAAKKLVLIRSANALNMASSNALLKVLEEPPSYVTFLLVSHNAFDLPATIVSRCQKWFLPKVFSKGSDYFCYFPIDSIEEDRALIIQNKVTLLGQIEQLLSGNACPHALLASWKDYGYSYLLWFFSVLFSSMIRDKISATEPQVRGMPSFQGISLFFLFKQLDTINATIKLIEQGVHLNEALVLENILIDIKDATNG